VRAPEEAVAGTAKVKASFASWKEGKVKPAEAEMAVVAEADKKQ
jgi:hypothetical protein